MRTGTVLLATTVATIVGFRVVAGLLGQDYHFKNGATPHYVTAMKDAKTAFDAGAAAIGVRIARIAGIDVEPVSPVSDRSHLSPQTQTVLADKAIVQKVEEADALLHAVHVASGNKHPVLGNTVVAHRPAKLPVTMDALFAAAANKR